MVGRAGSQCRGSASGRDRGWTVAFSHDRAGRPGRRPFRGFVPEPGVLSANVRAAGTFKSPAFAGRWGVLSILSVLSEGVHPYSRGCPRENIKNKP